uniref:Uncharacterized protein n=1 Tax=Romanomermis culicivorax TaxID=13658 RepID=A0A915IDA3_ROMCU
MNTSDEPLTLYKNSKLGNVKCFKSAQETQHEHRLVTKQWLRENVIVPQSLPEEEKQNLFALLEAYPDLYALDKKDTGRTTLVHHKIIT